MLMVAVTYESQGIGEFIPMIQPKKFERQNLELFKNKITIKFFLTNIFHEITGINSPNTMRVMHHAWNLL